MPKAAHGIPSDKLAAYEALVATNPKVARKGDKVPYTSVNGHMFSFLDPQGTLALRMSGEDCAAFRKKYKTPPVVSYGVEKKDYVAVPDALLAKTRELKKHFDASYAFVSSLKPNPTTKKAPGKIAPKKAPGK
jgi:hypothetical protein